MADSFEHSFELGDGWTIPDGASQEFLPPVEGDLIRIEFSDGRSDCNAIVTSVRPYGWNGWTLELITDAGMDDTDERPD